MLELSWQKGIIRADSGETLAYPKMSFQELMATPFGESAKVERTSEDYRKVFVSPVVITGYECGFQAYFHHDKLKRVFIVVTENTAKRFSFVTGYASPPGGPEVKFLEEWILREAGGNPPMSFSCGEIGNVEDAIVGFNRIIFIYR